jgi:hypothetical protein
LRGIRDRSELSEFNISRRLTARLGALLLKQIEVSPAIIEAAAPGSALEKFLLGPEFTVDLTPEIVREQAASAKLSEEEGLSVVLADSEEGWRIIALEDELQAEKAWGREKESAPSKKEKTGATQPLARRPVVERTEPETGGMFSPERINELKVTLVTSADSEAKIEALRLLCYSPIDPEEKNEALVQGLQDVTPTVRVEAATMTTVAGLDAGAVENLRSLAGGDEQNRVFAAERLGVYAREGKVPVAMFAVTGLVASLRHDDSAAVRRACLKSLEDSAAFLAANERRASELIKMLLVHLTRDYVALSYPARRLLVRMSEFLPVVVSQALWEEVGATPDRRIRVLLLTILGDIKGVDTKRLAKVMAEESARPEERGADFRSFATYMHALGADAAKALVEIYPVSDRSQRKYLVRLIDDICRYGKVEPAGKEEVAMLFKRYLSGANRDLRVTIMTAHIASDRELSDDTRRELARLFLENIHDVRMPTDIDNVEYTVSKMGMAATEPLVERLSERYPDGERIRAARLLGDLGRNEGYILGDKAAPALGELLRSLEKRRIDGFPEPGVILVSEGKIVSSPPVETRAADIVARSVMEQFEKVGPDAYVYEALGWAASSSKVNQTFIKKALKALCDMLDSPEAEIAPESRLEGDIKVFEIGKEAGFYTDLLPAAMKGLEVVYIGHRRSASLRKTIVGFLLRKWQEVTGGKRFWGPGNVTDMVDVLKRIAAHPSTDTDARVSVLKMLGRKLYSIPVMLAVGDILAADDSPGDMGKLASAVAVTLLKLRDTEGRFSEEERAEVLEVLGKIVRRRNLDVTTAGTEKLRYTIIESLFSGLRDGVASCYDALSPLRTADFIPDDLKHAIGERLTDYESIVPYAPV